MRKEARRGVGLCIAALLAGLIAVNRCGAYP
jgi:hypothetical protein